MVQYHATMYNTGFTPIDKLLDGGLKRGFVLELSSPPGTCKESLTLGMARAFVDNNQGVLFVGELYAPLCFSSSGRLNFTLHTRYAKYDYGQPATRRSCKLVRGPDMFRAEDYDGDCLYSPSTSSPERKYMDMILHTTLHTLPDLMIFLHKLPWYLDEYPRVSCRRYRLLFRHAHIFRSDWSFGIELVLVPIPIRHRDPPFCPVRPPGAHERSASTCVCIRGAIRE